MKVTNQRRTGPVKIAAYIRVSTDSTDQENSYETQERYFNRFLMQNHGCVSAGIYSDYGISGTSDRKRTGYVRLLRHCKEGKVNRIVCKSISRFARNTSDFMTALDVLHDNQATIYFEKENLDTRNPVNDFILTTLGAIAQEESRSISANIAWGFKRRFPKGEAGNRDIYGYRYVEGEGRRIKMASGYELRAVEIVEEEAAIVRRIFKEVAAGMTYIEVARGLNYDNIPLPKNFQTKKCRRKEMNIPAPKGELKDEIEQGWTAQNIARIVCLERYTGDVLLQKTYTSDYLTHKVRRNKGELEQYLVQNHHPAIISRELYDKVQDIREINSIKYRNRSKRQTYPFSGRLICGYCGRFFNTRNRKAHPIWFCPSTALHNGKTVCQAEKVYEEQIILMFQKAISERFYIAGQEEHFVLQVRRRLETAGQTDHTERDRNFLKCRIHEIENNPMEDKSKLPLLQEKLRYLEEYWKELENSYESRKKAIEWMETLPEGESGSLAFFRGITDEYVKAMALSITIYSPFRYMVHWFDDTKTVVEMEENIGDYRCRRAEMEK